MIYLCIEKIRYLTFTTEQMMNTYFVMRNLIVHLIHLYCVTYYGTVKGTGTYHSYGQFSIQRKYHENDDRNSQDACVNTLLLKVRRYSTLPQLLLP